MNKKTLLIIAFILSSIANNFARDISQKKHLVGFLAGFSLNTMGLQKNSSYDGSKNTIKPGGNFGINYEYRTPKVFGFEVGVNYANRGTQQTIEASYLNRSFYRLNFHSIEFPVSAKFYIGKKKIFNFNVGGFASYAFNVQSRLKVDLKDNSVFKDKDERVNNLLKDHNDADVNGNRPYIPYDAGITAGFEFVSKSGFGAGAKVQQGFIDFTNSKYIVPLDNKKVFHTNAIVYALFKI